MTQNRLEPEDLYLHYQRNRQKVDPGSGERARQTRASTESLTLAEQVYRQYQQQRVSTREKSIDAILSRVRTEQLSITPDLQTSAEIATASENNQRVNPEIRGEKHESIGLVATLVQISKSFFSQRLPRIVLPVVAAGLLALFVYPQIFNRADTDNSVPASLIAEAAVAVEFVDNGAPQVMGFSSGSAPGKSAFNRGVLATNVLIAGQSGDELAASETLQFISRTAEVEGQADLLKLVSNILSGKRTGITESGSTALESIEAMLKIIPVESGQELWFAHGQALQAVILSAQLQQSSTLSQPLLDSLEMYQALATPLPLLPGSELIKELKSMDKSSVTGGSGSRAVLGFARDIKILMQ